MGSRVDPVATESKREPDPSSGCATSVYKYKNACPIICEFDRFPRKKPVDIVRSHHNRVTP